MGVGGWGVAFLTHHHTFAAVGAPLPPLPFIACALWSVSGAALDDAEHARSDLVRSWISVISLPVACFASAMYIVQSLGRLTLTVATVLGHVTAF